MKIFKLLLIFIILFSTLHGSDLEKVSLQLSWKHQFEFAGYYMAKEKGFFKDANISVTFKELNTDIRIVKDVLNNKSTFGIGYPSIVLNKSKGSDIILLHAVLQSSPHVLVSLKSSGINSIKDFNNKRIMFDPNSIESTSLLTMLKSQKISIDSMKKVKQTFNIQDLIDNKTDLTNIFTSNEPYILDKKGIEYNIWDPRDYGFDFYDLLLFTSNNNLKNNPKMVNNFNKASLKGWEYAFNNIEETVDLILKKYNTQNKTKEALTYEAKVLKKLAYKDNISLGNINKSKIQRIYDIYNLIGLTKSKIDLDNFIYKDSNKLNLTSEEQEFIATNPIIKISHEINSPPYSFNKNNKQKGFSVDYLNMIFSQLDMNIKYVDVKNTSILQKMLLNGEIDIVPYASKSKKREKYFNFTAPYIKANKAIFSNDENIHSLDDLNNKIVSVVKNTTSHKYLEKNYPNIKLDLQGNFLDTIKSVVNNKADALIGEFAIINYLLIENSFDITNIKLIEKKYFSKDLHIVTRKDLTILRDIIDKSMANIDVKDLLTLKRKWFGHKIKNKFSLTKKEKQWIKNNTITIGISPWYPITFYDKSTNKISGVGFDIVNQVVQNLHLNVKYVRDTWHNLLTNFKDHKIDLLPTTYYTKQRATFGIYSEKYLDVKEQLYVKKSSKINSFQDLNNKTIAMVKAYGAIPKIKSKFPKIKIIEVDTLEKSIQMLVNNQVDAIFNTQFSVDSYINEHFIYNLKSIYQTEFRSSPLHFFSNKEKKILANILQKGLNSIDNTTKNNFLSKWINTETYELNKLDLFTNKEKEYLKNKKVIKMCIDPDWMPFEKIKDGKHIGMTASFFKIFEHNLGYKIELLPTKDWTQSLEFAKNRKCDILSLAMETPKRKKYMNFTSPYLKVPLVLATQNNKPFVNDFRTLNNKKVGIPKGYAFIELFKTKYPNLNIIEVKNINDGLEKVTTGELYGYIGTLASVGYAFQNRFVGELKIAGKFDEKWELGIAVRNDDLVLLNIFEKVIDSVNSVQSQKILNNWLAIKYEEQIDYKFLWKILLFVSIVILFFIYRQYILHKSNKNLQEKVDEKTKDLKILNTNLEVRIAEEVKKNLATQETLFKSERLAAMGEMIGNISHQWRQPLSVISTAATGMKMQKEYDILTDEMLISSCEAINNNAQYLSKTIDDFKNFIKGDRTKETFNLKTAIDGFLNLMEGTIKTNHINMILDIDDTLEINGYENELKQCLINIFNNAKDVLKEQEEKNRFLFITIKKDIKNDYVIILFKDSGGGVPENIKAKIFDPYFTTKHKSQGTGLGLNMAYKIITEGMNGTIKVDNIDYKYMNNNYTGAEFRITLPFS